MPKSTVDRWLREPHDEDAYYGGWYRHPERHPDTTINLVERDRELLGGIDLDPFADSASAEIIRPGHYYSLDRGQNGFRLPWIKPDGSHGAKFRVNPPWDGASVRKCVEKALHEHEVSGAWGLLHLPLLPDHPWLRALWERCPVAYIDRRLWYARPDGSYSLAGALSTVHVLVSGDRELWAEFASKYSDIAHVTVPIGR